MSDRLTTAELRGLVLDELDPTERKSVFRKIVRCADPDLPNVLENLEFEYRQEKADAQLSSQHRALGHLFLKKWRKFEARTDVFSRAESNLALKVAGPGDAADVSEGLRIAAEARDGEHRVFQIEAWAASSRKKVAVVISTDEEIHVARPMHQGSEMDGVLVRWQPSPRFKFDRSEGRATIWFVAVDEKATFGPAVPEAWEPLHDWLARLDADLSCLVDAVRLTPRALSDFYDLT